MLRRRRHEQGRAVAQRGEGHGPARHHPRVQDRAGRLMGRVGGVAARRVARRADGDDAASRARRQHTVQEEPIQRSTTARWPARAARRLPRGESEQRGSDAPGHPTSRRSKSAQPAAASTMPATRRIAMAPGSSPFLDRGAVVMEGRRPSTLANASRELAEDLHQVHHGEHPPAPPPTTAERRVSPASRTVTPPKKTPSGHRLTIPASVSPTARSTPNA